MLTFGGYPLYPTSNQRRVKCPECGEYYPDWMDTCPYCLGLGKDEDDPDN